MESWEVWTVQEKRKNRGAAESNCSFSIAHQIYQVHHIWILVKIRPLLKFIRNYIRDSSGVFFVFSLVRSFPALHCLCQANDRFMKFTEASTKSSTEEQKMFTRRRKLHLTKNYSRSSLQGKTRGENYKKFLPQNLVSV